MRNYKQEAKYHATPAQKKRRAARNAARRKLIKAGKVRKGDGKDVDHRNGNPFDNAVSNLKPKPKSKNRSYARTKSAGKKNPRA